MLIGYMRVSSNDEHQSVALQRDALIAVGGGGYPEFTSGLFIIL